MVEYALIWPFAFLPRVSTICGAALAWAPMLTCVAIGAERLDMTTGTLAGDARKVITSENGDIRIWNRPPRVLVLSTDARVWRMLQDIRDGVETEVSAPFGPPFFDKWHHIDILYDWDLQPEEQVRLSMVRGPNSSHEVEVRLASHAEWRADIVVVVGDRRTTALFNRLWKINPHYANYQAQRRPNACFVEARSRHGVRQGAYITIIPPQADDDLFHCLWEEFLHALGPLQDAHQSPFFGFNDREMTPETRANDILLIRALYESRAGPGGSPDVVIEYLEKIFQSE